MKTRLIKLITLIGLLALISGPTSVWAAEEEKPTASVDAGIFSKYMWRGYELSKGSIVIQPSATVGYKGFSFNMWGNLDMDVYGDDRDEAKWNETDLTIAYDTSFGPVGLGVGYIYYGLDGVDDSREFYVSTGLDVLLSPTLTVYREVAHIPSWYLNFGVSHSFELPKGMALDLAGSVGYYSSDDDDFVKVDSSFNPTTDKYSSLHDGLISASLTVPFGKYCSMSPMIAYSFPLTDDSDNLITSASFSNDSAFLFGGVTLSISF